MSFHRSAPGVAAAGELAPKLEHEIAQVPMDESDTGFGGRIEQVEVPVASTMEVAGADVPE
jgi:hypothetical protein